MLSPHTDRHTDPTILYPRCACAPRVITKLIQLLQLAMYAAGFNSEVKLVLYVEHLAEGIGFKKYLHGVSSY